MPPPTQPREQKEPRHPPLHGMCWQGAGKRGASACRQRALPSPPLWEKESKQIKPPQPGAWAERDSISPMGGLCSEREVFQQRLGIRLCRLRQHGERSAELVAPGMGEEAKHRSREPTRTSVGGPSHPRRGAQSCTSRQEEGDRHSC